MNAKSGGFRIDESRPSHGNVSEYPAQSNSTMGTKHFDLNDIDHEPSDEQLTALMESVASEARRRGNMAQAELMARLVSGLEAAIPSRKENEQR